METNEIIFLIIALAFVALVVFLIMFLVKANKTLCKVDVMLTSVQKHLAEGEGGQGNLLQNVNALSANVVRKMKCLDPLFNVVANVGEGLEFKTSNFKEKMYWKSFQDKYERVDERESSGVSDVVDCAMLGLNLWKKYKEKN